MAIPLPTIFDATPFTAPFQVHLMAMGVLMRFHLFMLLVVILTASGCGSGGPFDYVPVSGRVTYDDGSPLPGSFRLIFVAQNPPKVEGATPRPARANVNDQGEFDCVTSHKYGDGLIPGKHKVALQIAREQGDKTVIAREFTSSESTPLVIDTADSPLEIKVPKP
jgi:hypothetical protein